MTHTLEDKMSADDIIHHSEKVGELVRRYFERLPATTDNDAERCGIAAESAVMSKLTEMYLT